MQTDTDRGDMENDLDLSAQNTELERQIKQLKRDNKMLTVMVRNTEQLRNSFEAEKKLQYLYNDLLLTNCPNMIFLFNEQLRFVMCSKACLPLLGETKNADLVNLPFEQVFSSKLDSEWVQKVYRQNLEVAKTGKPCRYDDAIVRENNDLMHVQVAVAPIMDEEQGCCRGTIMTINDITELTQTKKMAEEAALSKSSFLANMSHEIRTPMNAVKGLSELLALTELNGLQRNYITNIIGSANSLLGIINDVLDFSKIDAKKVDFIEGPYDLGDLITGVCNVVNLRADDKNLILMIDADPRLPRTLMGDDVRIKQIITNLLSNAVKYTNEGFVKLSLKMETEGEISYLLCSVEDSGVGIKEEDLPNVFNAFSRVDLLANRNIAGTGLGLSIAKQLTLAMQGDIWVKSEYGKGSVFSCRIPQKIVDSRPIAVVNNPQSKKVLLLDAGRRMQYLQGLLDILGIGYIALAAGENPADDVLASFTHCIFDESNAVNKIRALRERMPNCRFGALLEMRHAMALSDYHDSILYLPLFITDLAVFLNREGRETEITTHAVNGADITLQDARILVVDDNEINLVVSSELLRSFNADVECAESGEDAIAFCNEQKYDLIFMDHMMPGKDGIETTAEIRASRGPNRQTPIIALTANVVNDMQSYYLRCGLDDFIGKPVGIADLGRVLHKWLPGEKVVVNSLPECGHGGESGFGFSGDKVTPDDLIEAMDNFGLYSSDVMRELNGNFDTYVMRMEEAGEILGDLVEKLKLEVSQAAWEDFSRDVLALSGLLHGIGARDCAGRARKLALAARDRNVPYIHGDFFSLMGNMYMLDKKLEAIVPLAKTGNLRQIPMNVPQALHGCLEKLGRALSSANAVEAMTQLANTASISLDMDLDMVLKAIKISLEQGDFNAALAKHAEIFRRYTEKLAEQPKENLCA